MPDKLHCVAVTDLISIPKATVEREAQDAYAAGLKPKDACPYPFHSQCGLHWLAIYNLCIPLPHRHATSSHQTQ